MLVVHHKINKSSSYVHNVYVILYFIRAFSQHTGMLQCLLYCDPMQIILLGAVIIRSQVI